jgi:phosphotransferase system enzyme I (PtsI)
MLLVGLGLRQLSMPPHQLPEVKRIIRGIRTDQARAVAAEALRQETTQAVVHLLHDSLRKAFPETLAKSHEGGAAEQAVTHPVQPGFP